MDNLDNLLINTQEISSGTERFSISIGGIRFSIICQDTRFLKTLQARYQWFESTGPTTYEILVRILPFEELALENMGQPCHPQVMKINSGDNYIIRRTDNPFLAIVNTLSKKVLVKLWDSEYCFDSFLRMLFTLIMAQEGGLVIHASAISDGEQGDVFFGPSGSGKTTVTRLSTNRIILTDELALIKPHNGEYRVYGTPFWGEFTPGRSNAHARLRGLYSLKKAQKNSLVPMDRVRAVEELYQCVLFFSKDSHLLQLMFNNCCVIVDKVPSYELHFLSDPSFWQVVDRHG